MIHYSKVLTGVTRFLNNDIALKLKGTIKYWIFTTAADIFLSDAAQIMQRLSNSETLVSRGLVEGEMINIDKIYTSLHARAQESPANIDLKMLGTLTLTVQDVEKLYQYIREA